MLLSLEMHAAASLPQRPAAHMPSQHVQVDSNTFPALHFSFLRYRNTYQRVWCYAHRWIANPAISSLK